MKNSQYLPKVWLLLWVGFLCFVSSCGRNSLDQQLREANRLSQSQKIEDQVRAAKFYDDLIDKIFKAIEKNYQLQKRLGRRLLLERNYTMAEKFLKRALELNPQDPEVSLYLGMVYVNMASYKPELLKKAESFYKQALNLKSDLWDAWYGLAVIDLIRGDLDEAKRKLVKILEKKKDYVAAWKKLAEIHRDEGDEISAIQLYQKALSYVPKNTEDEIEIRRQLGRLYLSLDDRVQARKQWERILKILKFDAEAQKALEEIKRMK